MSVLPVFTKLTWIQFLVYLKLGSFEFVYLFLVFADAYLIFSLVDFDWKRPKLNEPSHSAFYSILSDILKNIDGMNFKILVIFKGSVY